MTHIAIPIDVAPQYWHHAFSELVALADTVTDGICDADARDRALWDNRANPLPGEKYDGLTGWGARERMRGYAVFRRGGRTEFGHDDVAALWTQFN
jgi:hypothetical protein